MLKPLGAVAGALIAALVLTACSAAALGENRPWAAGCARAEADVRDAALEAGLTAFGAAQVGYRYHKRPLAIGEAAQKLMRDIRAVQATCSQKH